MFPLEVWTAHRRSSTLAIACLGMIAWSPLAGAQAPAPTPAPTQAPEASPATANAPPPPATSGPAIAIQTGAPQPLDKNQALPLPSQPPPPPGTPVVKVGGGMILLYSNNYAPAYDPAGNKKKHIIDVWRANIVLDAKMERFGIHIDFRARDRGLRWMPVNAWLEELYASADFPELAEYGPLTLKVGKAYNQFGRFWDNSFYGNVHLRDGLKLVPDWGLSFEGTLNLPGAFDLPGALSMKYYAQYFVVDGQTSTANNNRDTISIVAPGTNTLVGGRKRDQFVFRVEPTYVHSPTMKFALGASFSHFTADFPDAASEAATMAGRGVKDIDNKSGVTRFGFDASAQVLWFGFWAEFTKQLGRHSNAYPYNPRADNPATPESEAREGSGSDNVTYWLVGANFTWDRFTLQYNFNSATYNNIPVPGMMGVVSRHKEWIHNPGLAVKINDQLRFLLEFPFWMRTPAAGLPPYDPEKPAMPTGETDSIEQQVVATLHGRF
jgi:hypothetical protein